jgi:hypothetical protein
LQIYTVYGPDKLPRIPKGEQKNFFDGYVNWVVAGNAIISAQFGTPRRMRRRSQPLRLPSQGRLASNSI